MGFTFWNNMHLSLPMKFCINKEAPRLPANQDVKLPPSPSVPDSFLPGALAFTFLQALTSPGAEPQHPSPAQLWLWRVSTALLSPFQSSFQEISWTDFLSPSLSPPASPLKKKINKCVCVLLPACMSAYHVCGVLTEELDPLKLESQTAEMLYRCQELKLGSLEEQPVRSTAELSLHLLSLSSLSSFCRLSPNSLSY